MSRLGLGLVAALASATAASAQTTVVEVAQHAGASSESIVGTGTQLRLFGETRQQVHFKIEGAWGTRTHRPPSGQYGSDVLGTAYPYGNRLELVEAYAEYFPRTGRVVRSVRAGRYRTPFGMSSASDHAYVGFLRPPLMRYGTYYGLSATYLEHGLDVVVGTARVSAELSLSRSADIGEAIRRPGWNAVVRGQGAFSSVVVGVSAIDTMPYLPAEYAAGRARFVGIDARWMAGGVQVRGEWINGKPFNGTITRGGYVDLFVHRPSLGPVTIVGRVDRLDYVTAPPFELYTHRYTVGARVRLAAGLSAALGVTHQGRQLTQRRPTAIEAGVSYTLRKDF